MSLANSTFEEGEKLLPYETWSHLFSFLDGYTLVSIIHTCKTFQSIADCPEIWECAVRSYRKKGELAQKFLPEAAEIAYSVADDPDLGDDEEDTSEEMIQIRKIMESADSTQDAMDQLQKDPRFQAFFSRLSATVPDSNTLLQEAPDLLGKYYTSLQAQADRFKSDKLSKNVDWKHIYRILSRSLVVHAELEYAGEILADQLTSHTPVAGGNRKRLFFSLREALKAALPGDSIYLHSSEEEKSFPDNMKSRHFKLPKPQPMIFDQISKAVTEIESDRLKARKERDAMGSNQRTLDWQPRTLENYMLNNGSTAAEEIERLMHPQGNGPRIPLPYIVVTTPNLTIFGRDGGQMTEEPGAGIMVPLVWAAPGGTIATVDAVRGFIFVAEQASLRTIDVNFEVPCYLSNRGSLAMIDCNVHTMEDDIPFLLLPPDGFQWHLFLDRVDISSRLDVKEAFSFYLKLISPPMSFAEVVPSNMMSDFGRFVHQKATAFFQTDPNLIEDQLTSEELSERREQFLTTILTLLDQNIFDDPDLFGSTHASEFRLGHLIRQQLAYWLPHFLLQGNEKLVGMALASLKSLPEDQLLSQIDEIPIPQIAVPMIERFIDSETIPFTCVALISKLCWASDVLAMKIGQSPALWSSMTILFKKCMGVIGKDTTTTFPSPVQQAQATPSLLDSSSEILPPPTFVRASCYHNANAISHLLGLAWSFSTYPETAVLVVKYAMDFILWAGKTFPKVSSVIENICGIGHALLDCLPHTDTSRVDCAKHFLANGAMEMIVQAYRNFPLSEVLENADYFALLLMELCPGAGMSSFLEAGGLEVLIKTIERRSKESRGEGTIDLFTILPSVVEVDSAWQTIKPILDDQMFTTDRATQKLGMIAAYAHGIARSPKRRLEFVNMGYLRFIESIAPEGYQMVSLFVDSLDTLARDEQVLKAKAEQLKSAALHMQTFSQSEDTTSWINTVVDATKLVLEGTPAVHTGKIRISALGARENETKVSSDGLTCVVTHHSFHSFVLELPDGYLKSGKWAYEIMLNSDGPMQLGWATADFKPSIIENLGCGDDVNSWAVDYNRLIKWHKGIHPLSNFVSLDPDIGSWMRGQVVTCMADFEARTLEFYLNAANQVLFENVDFLGGIRPAFTLARGQSVTINVGVLPFMHSSAVQYRGFVPVGGQVTWTEEQIRDRVEELNARLEAMDVFDNILDMEGVDVDSDDEENEEDEEMDFDMMEEEEEDGERGDEEDEEDGDGQGQGFHFGGPPRRGVNYGNMARRR